MPRRRSRRARGGRAQVLPYDFWGTTSTATKNITKSDLGLENGRQFRVVRAVVEASAADKVDYFLPQFPIMHVLVNHGTAADACTTSRPVTLSVATRRVSVRVPRVIDFSEAPANFPLVELYFAGEVANVTVSFSGTVWVQFAGHKHTSKVSFIEKFNRLNINPAIEEGIEEGYDLVKDIA